jgi:hypothetical protein
MCATRSWIRSRSRNLDLRLPEAGAESNNNDSATLIKKISSTKNILLDIDKGVTIAM